jgi:coproporphyrinogen III oxidase-like Fe-S oxidoreductase
MNFQLRCNDAAERQSVDSIFAVFGEDFEKNHKESIARFVKEGLLKVENRHLIPTYEGMMILDTIIVQFMSD